jgi:CheY-like chemotaxis protein
MGAGLQVSLANNGQEAVEALKEHDFDAVLMDIQMPVLDGYKATRRIRKWEEELKAQSSKLKAKDRGQRAEDRRQKAEDKTQASSLQPPTCNIPIIAMTAHAMADDREKSLEAGMNDHVAKPIDPNELFATLGKWIRAKADLKNSQSSETGMPEKAGQTTSDEIPLSSPAKAETDDFPESLSGFDLAAGLKRLQGNRRLYRKLLVDFAANYAGAADDIQKTLAAGDMAQVHSLVHNLKGLAGNLSATGLYAAATNMDGAVKQTLSDNDQRLDRIDPMFAELKNFLDQALASCKTLKQTPAKDTPGPTGDFIPSMPSELAKDTAENIREAVEMGNVTELKAIADALKARSDEFTGLGEKIRQMAEDFDFDAILQLAREIEERADG